MVLQHRLHLMCDVRRQSCFELGNQVCAFGVQSLALHAECWYYARCRARLGNVKQEQRASSICILMISRWQSLYPRSNALQKKGGRHVTPQRKQGDAQGSGGPILAQHLVRALSKKTSVDVGVRSQT
jgi:hypothetical protein